MRNSFFIFSVLISILNSGCREKEEFIPASPPDKIIGYDWQPDTVILDSVYFSIDSDIPNVEFRKLTVYAGTSQSGGSYYNYFIQAVGMDSSVMLSPGIELDQSQQVWNCIDSGAVINQNLTWLYQVTMRANVIMAGAVGIWDINPSNGYLAVRIKSNGVYKYGWFRLTATLNWYLAIDAYAYNATPGRSIVAGQLH